MTAPPQAQPELPQGTVEQTIDWVTRIWEFRFFTVDNAPVTVGKLVIALLVLIVGTFAARIVAGYIGRRVLPRLNVDRGPAAAIQSIIYYSLLAIVILLALEMASVPLGIFTLFGGALALGVGFGSQNIVNNFMSGLILLIERPVAVGDLVELDGDLGEVEKIGARSTVVKSYQGTSFIIPNSALLENTVQNWNHRDDLVRVTVSVGVAYGSPTDRVRELVMQACGDDQRILDEPAPEVLFTEFGDNALAFEAHFWTRPDGTLERLRIESDLRYRVDALFREADICIAFPQRDIHIDSTKPLEVRMLPETA